MKTIIALATALALATPALAAPVTDCKVLVGGKLADDDGKEVTLVLPVRGTGVLDFHFSFAGGHARLGGDTAKIAVCKVGETDEGKPLMSTVYRANVEKGRATIAIAMPDKGSAKVSVVAGKKIYFGTVVAGEAEVRFGDKTPETSWKEEAEQQ